MKFYTIIYDLRQPGRKYNELYDAIKAVGEGNWQHPMESFWVVALSDYSSRNANNLYDEYRKYIDDNDSLIVNRMDITEYQGWMPKSFWEWINENKNKQ